MGGRRRNDGSSSCIKRVLNMLLSLSLLGVVAVAIWYFLGQPATWEELTGTVNDIYNDINWDDWDDFGNFTPNVVLPNISDPYEDLFDFDPFVSDNSTDSLWRTQQYPSQGLDLELLNALDDTWTNEFTAAVQDWQQADSLSLTTSVVSVDHECSPVDGVMKVCNGNYGPTGWLGINEIISAVGTGEIFSSVAKMNEYYLLNGNQYERQYTMCHEIGHGFGLPHTDENFHNPDLGNCLDYTSTPQNNLHPDETNYARLRSLYGSFPGSNSGGGNTVSAATGPEGVEIVDEGDNNEGGGGGKEGSTVQIENSDFGDRRRRQERRRRLRQRRLQSSSGLNDRHDEHMTTMNDRQHHHNENYRHGGRRRLRQKQTSVVPSEVKQRYLEVMEEFHSQRPHHHHNEQHRRGSTNKWRVLHQHPNGVALVHQLTKEYELTVHVLMKNMTL